MNIVKRIQAFLEKGGKESSSKCDRKFALFLVFMFGVIAGAYFTLFFLSIKWVWEGKAYGDCLGF